MTTAASSSFGPTRPRRRLGRIFLTVAAASALLIAVVGPGGPAAHATPSTVVVPNALATTEGGYDNNLPFNCLGPRVTSMRYQEVYAGAQVGSGTISQVAFRDGQFASTVIPNVTITLSTTSRAVTGLDTTFANNIGADVTNVFSGNLTLAGAGTGGAPPGPFDIVIPLQTPFTFNAAAGNLLLDVTIPTCERTALFDATFVDTAPVIARVYAFTSGAATGQNDDTQWGGLVTQFTLGGTTTGCTSPKTGQPVTCPKSSPPPTTKP